MAAGVREPRNSDTIAQAVPFDASSCGNHLAHDLVPWDDVRLRVIELAVDDVEIRPADAAGVDLDQDPMCLWRGNRDGAADERRARPFQSPLPSWSQAAGHFLRHVLALVT